MNNTSNEHAEEGKTDCDVTVEPARKVAYFSMEIGIDAKIPTYSGGLGVLAGDMIRSRADLKVPLVAVTLLYRKGYFDQTLDEQGNQQEFPAHWNPQELLTLLPQKVRVSIARRTVMIQAWEYNVIGITGYCVPVLFLDTDLPENSASDRSLTDSLYGGDETYRFAQEIVLGIGGVRMLEALGYHQLNRYHLNEGHASLLTLELLHTRKKPHESGWDLEGVRRMCVFTTHTPVPAGMDQFSYDLVGPLLDGFIDLNFLKRLGGEDRLNMTRLALNLSHYENGVAKEHGAVSREMFPGYRIDYITNGVHSATWVCESFQMLYDTYIPGWRSDPFSLRYALSIPNDEVWSAHTTAKTKLIEQVNATTHIGLDAHTLTIGFARRATAYKRADLLLWDVNRLLTISQRVGKIQVIFAGKAHPRDWQGKDLIKKIVAVAQQVKEQIKIVYLENYDQEVAKMLIAGVDVWLNTPQKPKEASGTSGMKAAHNGVPSFSILDGWWIEGCLEGLTGWAIGSALDVENDNQKDADSLYAKLEQVIIPTFYTNRRNWMTIMRHTIAMNASFFNTHRMVLQYALKAYLE